MSPPPRTGPGLQGIADRLDALGGALRIESAAEQGTTLHGTVPAGDHPA